VVHFSKSTNALYDDVACAPPSTDDPVNPMSTLLWLPDCSRRRPAAPVEEAESLVMVTVTASPGYFSVSGKPSTLVVRSVTDASLTSHEVALAQLTAKPTLVVVDDCALAVDEDEDDDSSAAEEEDDTSAAEEEDATLAAEEEDTTLAADDDDTTADGPDDDDEIDGLEGPDDDDAVRSMRNSE